MVVKGNTSCAKGKVGNGLPPALARTHHACRTAISFARE
jgi:hypothetical protein